MSEITLAGGCISSPFNSSSRLNDLGPGMGRAWGSGGEVFVSWELWAEGAIIELGERVPGYYNVSEAQKDYLL